jgi:hypothetical protein
MVPVVILVFRAANDTAYGSELQDFKILCLLRYVVELAELYGLPFPHDLLDTPPGKYQWKQLVNKAVYIYHSNRLSPQTEETQAKS